jgi:hypothetical protein
MLAAYKEIANSKTINPGNEETVTIELSGFSEPPIVTATPRNIGGTAAGSSVSVTLKSVTTTAIEVIVKFNAAGNATVGINVIAIGIPK